MRPMLLNLFLWSPFWSCILSLAPTFHSAGWLVSYHLCTFLLWPLGISWEQKTGPCSTVEKHCSIFKVRWPTGPKLFGSFLFEHWKIFKYQWKSPSPNNRNGWWHRWSHFLQFWHWHNSYSRTSLFWSILARWNAYIQLSTYGLSVPCFYLSNEVAESHEI